MSELLDIPIAELVPHPDNPRLEIRSDVVDQIAVEIGRSGFGREHAMLVRPIAGGYEIISGHHRHEAAKRVGLKAVPCWVREMDDEEAFMQLVLTNTQGELSALEMGMHALTWTGQQKDYAARLDMDKSTISIYRTAARVAQFAHSNSADLIAFSRHLYEISKAPESGWSLLVGVLVDRGWSVAETSKHVEQVKALEYAAGRDLVYAEEWLPLSEIVARYLDVPERFTPRTVDRLVSAASDVEKWIDANAPDQHQPFLDWLTANRGGESWDHRAIVAYQQRLLAERWEVRGWHHGDWRDHLDELDETSVSLVLTDPPYGTAYRSGYRAEQHEHIVGDDGDAMSLLKDTLAELWPKLAADAHVLVFCTWGTDPETRHVLESAGYTVRGSLVWEKNNTSMGDLDATFASKHERIIHAVKGSPKLYRRAPDVLAHDRESSARHPTEKPVSLLAELIEATTTAGQIVADPFAGVASTCVAAKETGRKWWGCEIDENYWNIGEERLS